jgi:MFS family permease
MSSAHRTFLLLSLAYILSQFHRSALAVIGVDLGLSVAEVGTLTATFFIAFMFMQVPSGIFLDRFGAKRTMAALLVINALGSALFAISGNYGQMFLARIVLGFGNAALLIGALFVINQILPKEQFAKYSAIFFSIGTLGNLLSTYPTAVAHSYFGWRAIFWFTTLIALLFAWLLYQSIKDNNASTTKPEGVMQIIKGLGKVFVVKDFTRLFFLQLTLYSSSMTVFAVWGAPFLKEVYGLTSEEVGKVLLIFPIVSIIAYLSTNGLDMRFNARKPLIVFGLSFLAISLFTLCFYKTAPLWVICLLFGLNGFAAGFFPFVLAHCRALFPESLLGRGIAVMNLANMGGVGVMQLLTVAMQAWLITHFDSVTSYRIIFGFVALLLTLALIHYAGAEDKKPFPDKK